MYELQPLSVCSRYVSTILLYKYVLLSLLSRNKWRGKRCRGGRGAAQKLVIMKLKVEGEEYHQAKQSMW